MVNVRVVGRPDYPRKCFGCGEWWSSGACCSIHKSKAKKAREKTLSDQFEAKRAKNKASRERKIARREERLAQGPGERAPPTAAAAPASQPAQGSKKAKK
ncbi:unnamed protein product [Fraxinus pennsylvanica]|uniref:Uncharacterized protein n=1 Tax=Fraxinus pennsylvanica TaxID=56036 RepID=A0AAD2DT20_9LAMI|nr:unnamed protein product [Fraxinus pennsylvanica]